MSLISKLATGAALALSLAASASHATTIQVQGYPKVLAPRTGATYDQEAIMKAAKVIAEDTLKYVVESTSNVCGNTGLAGQNVKVYLPIGGGKAKLVATYGVPENGFLFASQAVQCH